MKTKLLPSLSERWDELYNRDISELGIVVTYHKFHNFLKQEPKLGMFVATDEKGNVLDKPEEFDKYDINHCHIYMDTQTGKPWAQRCFEYQQALDRVIFDGFEVKRGNRGIRITLPNKLIYDHSTGFTIKTLADLVGKVYVNENGIKDSGL